MLCVACLKSVCELLGETIRNMFGRGCLLLLNVMEMSSLLMYGRASA